MIYLYIEFKTQNKMNEADELLENLHRIGGALDAYNKIIKLTQEPLTMFELRMKIYELTENLFKNENKNEKI